MSDTLTAIFQFVKPQVGASTNTWGGKLNGDADSIDSLLAMPQNLWAVATAGALNLVNGFYQQQTVAGATVFSFTNVPANPASGKTIATRVVLKVINGGSAAVTWPGSVTWLSGGTPLLKAAGTDLLELVTFDNGTTWLGVHLGANDGIAVVHPTVGVTTPIDLSLGTEFAFTDSQTTTLVISNVTAGTPHIRLFITNGAAHVITFPGSVTWIGGTIPVFHVSGVDVVDLYSPDTGTTWYAARAGYLDHRNDLMRFQYHDVGTVVTANTDHAISFASASVDVGGWYNGANQTRATVPATFNGGVMVLVADTAWQTTGESAGTVWVWVLKNGSTLLTTKVAVNLAAGQDSGVTHGQQAIAVDPNPVAGDYYECFVRHSTSNNSMDQTFFSGVQVG